MIFGFIVVRAPAVRITGPTVLDVDGILIISISACHRIDPFSM
jgi:hypothetical protein